MPPKIDKSHGFMQSIIKNQVLRDEYDKQQKLVAGTKEIESIDEKMSSSSEASKTRSRTPRRAGIQLYVPPHVKKKDEPNEPSPKNSPEPTKRPTKEASTNIRELKRTRKSTPSKEDTSASNFTRTRTLFKFEYEDDSGKVRTLYVQEDDNAEDLAETFGNQLGLTKTLKRALKHKLSNEIKSCLNDPSS